MADLKAGREAAPTGFSASDFAGVGIQFALAILLFLFVGRWVDARLGTAPVFLIAGTFVGAAGGFYSMYRKVTAATRAEQAAKARLKATRKATRKAPPEGGMGGMGGMGGR